MKARDLARAHPSIRADAPAIDAANLLAEREIRAVLVLGEDDRLVGVVSDSTLLRSLLPSYVDEAAPLARVIDEAAADLLSRRLQDRSALDLLVDADGPPPQIDGDATLVEVASVMAWLHVPLVAVVEDDRLLGAISIDELLSRLLGRG